MDFVDKDKTKITWDRPQIQGIEKNKSITFNENSIQECIYRPFTKLWGYTDEKFNNCVYQLPKIFPNQKKGNLVILAPGTGNKNDFSTFITDKIPDLGFLSSCYCFPLKIYSKFDEGLFNIDETDDAITDEALNLFKKKLKISKITKRIFSIMYMVCFIRLNTKQNIKITFLKKYLEYLFQKILKSFQKLEKTS